MSVIYMMIGVSGSGKSTFARKVNVETNGKTRIVSSDDIREELYGDASIQNNPKKIFSIVHKRIKEGIEAGEDVVFDATNLTKKNRKSFFIFLKENGIKADVIACVFPTPIEECIARQQRRVRKVPTSVIQKQFAQFEMPLVEEGFYAIATFEDRKEE